jgi:threonine 3-dehydrogenase
MKELGMTEGFDVGLEMSGSPQAFQSMLETMNHGGRIAMLGIFSQPVAIDWSQVIFKGLHLKGIYGREMFETWYKMSTMLESGLDISGVITHVLPASEFEHAFEIVRAGQSGKVILDW